MKIIVQSVIAVTAVCLLAGCDTTGLSPRESAGVNYPNYILSLQTGDGNAPEKVSTPIKLAVAQVGEAAPSEAMLNTLAAKKSLVASVTALPLPGGADNGLPYNNVTRSFSRNVDYQDKVKALCGVARATGADYVFLFGGDMDSWQENNPLSVLDITIVADALVPGTKIHVEGKGAGALISTATCRPILFVSADAKDSASSPDYLSSGKTMSMEAAVRDQLAAKLTEQLLNSLSSAAFH